MLLISEKDAATVEFFLDQIGGAKIKIGKLAYVDDKKQFVLDTLGINYGAIPQEEVCFLFDLSEDKSPSNKVKNLGARIFSRQWGKRLGGYEAKIEINGPHCKLLAGSKLKKDAAQYLSFNTKFLGYKDKRDRFLLEHMQDIEKHEDKEFYYTLKKDIPIATPVLACVIAAGIQDNGKGWHDDNGLTIEEWRDSND